MKRKLFLWILFGFFTLIILTVFLKKVVVEPWIGRKIQSASNDRYPNYLLEIGNVHLSLWKAALELDQITIITKPEQQGIGNLKGEIESIRFEGIHLWKAIFKKDIEIAKVTILSSTIKGSIPFPEKPKPPEISKLNFQIDSIFLDQTNLSVKNTLTTQAFSLKDGVLKFYDLKVAKGDTLAVGIVRQFDFDVQELSTVSSDSMYTFTATAVSYLTGASTLSVDSFSIHPNYKDYDFTSRHEFQTDRIEAGFNNIMVHGFSASEYLKASNLVSSYIEIRNLNLYVFRDQRKPFRHTVKPTFQEMMYKYPAELRIDSIGILNGNITASQHAAKANEPGYITFNEVKAEIIKVSNDTTYKTEKAFFEFNAEALLMGKGKLTTKLKAQLFEPQNTFSLDGSLSGMDIKALNPILEKTAFIFATSGEIDAMNFGFLANNTKATGKMTLLYHDLHIAVKNKRTDDTTAIKERLISLIANAVLLNSNPNPGEAVRIGTINYKRDPERFLFNYSAKSIFSGMKTSIAKSSAKKD